MEGTPPISEAVVHGVGTMTELTRMTGGTEEMMACHSEMMISTVIMEG